MSNKLFIPNSKFGFITSESPLLTTYALMKNVFFPPLYRKYLKLYKKVWYTIIVPEMLGNKQIVIVWKNNDCNNSPFTGKG